MAITFPAGTAGAEYTNPTTGVKYYWDTTDGVWKTHVWPTNTNYLQLSGGTLTGDLSLGTNDLTAQDITTTGSVTVGNGLTVSDGNVVMASGHGIDFSADANAAGMTSELLDDYEEGTWTPAFANAGTATYSVQTGHFIKVGNLVTVQFMLQFSNSGNASGNVEITGFPFAPRNISNIYAVSSSVHGTGWSVTRNSLNILIPPNQTQSNSVYYNMAAQGTTYGQAQHSDLGTGNLLASFTYLAN